MKKIYFVNPNGSLLSNDKKTKFSEIKGEELNAFIKGVEKRGRYFYTFEEKGEDTILIECSKQEYQESERIRLQNRYKKERNFKDGYLELSINEYVEDMEKDVEVSEVFIDEEAMTENLLETKELRKKLYDALNQLSEEEYKLIFMLFLAEETLTEREYAKLIGVSQKCVNKRKHKILKKLKSFF